MNISKSKFVLLASCLFLLTGGSSDKSYFVTAKGLIEKHKFKDALVEIDRLLKKKPNDDTVLLMRAEVLFRLGRARDALMDIDEALRINPKLADAYYLRTQIYFAAHSYKKALADAEKTVALKPDSSDAHSALGVVRFYGAGDFEGAIDAQNRAVKLNPKNANAWMNRGALYFKMEHLDRAKSDLDRSLRLDPNDTQALNTRGRILHALKQYELAIKDFDRAIKLNPHNSDWFNNKALALVRLNRFDEAIEWYTRAIAVEPNGAQAYNNRGAAYMRTKRLKEAEIDFKKSLQLDPKYASAHSNVAALYALRGQDGRAKTELDTAIELDPNDGNARRNRGTILARTGAFEESLMDLESAKEHSRPINAKISSKGEFQAVVDTCTRFLKINPGNQEAYFDRGFAYFCMRDMTAALRDLDVFIRMAGSDSKSAINAAILSNLAHRQLGHDSKQARKDVDSMLKNSPAKIRDYWGWSMASYLNGTMADRDLQVLKLTKISKTRLNCYLAIDRSLTGDRDGALKLLNWIQDYGDREVDEFDLAMTWLSHLKIKSEARKTASDRGVGK